MQMRTNALQRLYGIAEHQGGHVTTRQADEIGVSRQSLSQLTDRGHLERVRSGLYRLTRFPAVPHEDMIVALLTMGADTAISHESALVVYGLSDAMPARIHVTRPRRWQGRGDHVRVHLADLDEDEVTVRDRVRVTTLPRTLGDVLDRDPGLARQALDELTADPGQRRARLRRWIERYPHLEALTQRGDSTVVSVVDEDI